jgi:hypothetical protein
MVYMNFSKRCYQSGLIFRSRMLTYRQSTLTFYKYMHLPSFLIFLYKHQDAVHVQDDWQS